MGFSDKVDTLMFNAIASLRSNGAEVIEIEFPKGENYEEASFEVMLYEFKDGLNKYLSGLGSDAPVKNLAELIVFNRI